MIFASKILIQRKSFSSNSHTSLDKGSSIMKHTGIGVIVISHLTTYVLKLQGNFAILY